MIKFIKFTLATFLFLNFLTGCSNQQSVNNAKTNGNSNVTTINANSAVNGNVAIVINSNVATAGNSNSSIAVNGANVSNSTKSASDSNEPIGKFNLTNFNRLETGMKYEEVAKILGSKGETSDNTQGGASKMQMYKWSDATGSFIKVIFIDGKLYDKAQTGLR